MNPPRKHRTLQLSSPSRSRVALSLAVWVVGVLITLCASFLFHLSPEVVFVLLLASLLLAEGFREGWWSKGIGR